MNLIVVALRTFDSIFKGAKNFSLFPGKSQDRKKTLELIEKTLAKEYREMALQILEEHGNDSLDFFKLKDKKNIFLYKNSFVAYKIHANNLIVLGDPVGPQADQDEIISKIRTFCKDHEWNLCFFQSSEKSLERFTEAGMHKINIGAEAVVDIENFNLVGPKKKDFRNRIRKLEKLGFFTKVYKAGDIDAETFEKLKDVSDQWLDEPNRIERSFSLGYFSPEYINETEIMTVENDAGEIVAFVNFIPCYSEASINIDFMRKSKSGPSGVMDYIFVKAILELQERGFKRLNLGLAPMSGLEKDNASFTENAVHSIFQKLSFLFNYQGLKVFKDKFATSWDTRYLIFENIQHLPGLALSIKKVLEELES